MSRTTNRAPDGTADAQAHRVPEQWQSHSRRDVHNGLRLWRVCKKKACKRVRRCCGDLEQCNARNYPDAKVWWRHWVTAAQTGLGARAAARLATQQALAVPARSRRSVMTVK